MTETELKAVLLGALLSLGVLNFFCPIVPKFVERKLAATPIHSIV